MELTIGQLFLKEPHWSEWARITNILIEGEITFVVYTTMDSERNISKTVKVPIEKFVEEWV